MTTATTAVTTAAASIPVWVPVLFLGLLAIGWRQSRERLVRARTLTLVALGMGVLSWTGLRSSLGTEPATVVLWLSGLLAALAVGGRLMGLQDLQKVGEQVRMPGSWWPMGLILTVFSVRFALGWAHGVHSPLLDTAWFGLGCASLLGLCSGAFGARALAVRAV